MSIDEYIEISKNNQFIVFRFQLNPLDGIIEFPYNILFRYLKELGVVISSDDESNKVNDFFESDSNIDGIVVFDKISYKKSFYMKLNYYEKFLNILNWFMDSGELEIYITANKYNL